MKNNYSFFIGFLLLITIYSSIAQPGWTIYDNSNTILVSGTYTAISIDQTGNIWVGGSYTGLFKYNGTTWTRYYTSNSNILHDDINSVLVDNSNKVWVANYKGISVYNGTTFTNYDTLNAAFKGSEVYALGKDINGKIWLSSKNGSFGYKGITTFDGTTWTNLTGYPSQILGREFPDFAFTPSNVAWIACEVGITNHNGSFVFYPYATTGLWSSSCVAVDASSNIWAGGFSGLLKYNGSSWSYFDNVTSLGLTSNVIYYDIFADGNILWIATSSGLLKFDRINGVILVNYQSSNSPLEDNCVVDIAKDASGSLWLATSIGVVKMDPTQGVEENKKNNQVNIYPNPATKIITIETPQTKENTLIIYDVAGQEMIRQQYISNKAQVDISTLSSGIYFVKLITDKWIEVRKVVKE